MTKVEFIERSKEWGYSDSEIEEALADRDRDFTEFGIKLDYEYILPVPKPISYPNGLVEK